jgi:hypothetical protein
MQFPQINLNGTASSVLLRQNLDAMESVNQALKHLGDAAPHGRDYQTLDSQAYPAAHLEHVARRARLEAVRDELSAIAVEISRQMDARRCK